MLVNGGTISTLNFSGSGTDYNGTPIPASGLSWTIIAHHCPQGSCHSHFLETVDGAASGSVVVPDHGDDVYLELQLTATNSAGLTDTDTVNVNPQLVTLTFDSVPTGLNLNVDGSAGFQEVMLRAFPAKDRRESCHVRVLWKLPIVDLARLRRIKQGQSTKRAPS